MCLASRRLIVTFQYLAACRSSRTEWTRSSRDAGMSRRTRRMEDCCICLGSMQRGVRSLPCKHSFHASCIKRWLEEKESCPLCQTPVYTLSVDDVLPPCIAGICFGMAAACTLTLLVSSVGVVCWCAFSSSACGVWFQAASVCVALAMLMAAVSWVLLLVFLFAGP